MKQSIDADLARRDYGISANHELMPNAELRFRLMGDDGNGYIRTVAQRSGWQLAHSHSNFREAYIVEREWMIIATPDESDNPLLTRYESGQIYVSSLSEVHNVYLPAGAVIHTVKFGVRDGKGDWKKDCVFTEKTRNIYPE